MLCPHCGSYADEKDVLCPGCGANLNRETCRCKKQVDPRLAALAKLLPQEEA